MKKEIFDFFNKNFEKLGYRERKVLLASFDEIRIEESKVPGVFELTSPYGSFEFAWNLEGYERGTILG